VKVVFSPWMKNISNFAAYLFTESLPVIFLLRKKFWFILSRKLNNIV
jgi:hypothetical protein